METSKNKFWKHKSAEVQKGAKIGNGTKIWHSSQVLKNAEIGENCTIGHNCLVGEGAKIGNKVKIQSNTDVWYKVNLADFVFVGPSVVFTNDLNPRSCYPKNKEEWLPTFIKKGATLGANCTIVCGHTVGEWAFIGAGAVVADDIPDYALAYGVPAKIAGWVCECGNKLVFKNNKAICKACQRKYKKTNNQINQIK
jgi:UDP-2-acetamido-3-amino-2,3-dideoxy-glucuronate N-acetyltransferase